MWNSAKPPLNGVRESWAAFTAPVEVPVVEIAHSVDGPLTEPGLLALHRASGGRRAARWSPGLEERGRRQDTPQIVAITPSNA